MILGGGQRVPDERNTVRTRFENTLALLDRQIDEKRHLLEDGVDGGLR